MKSTLRNTLAFFAALSFVTHLPSANEHFRPLTETAFDHLLQEKLMPAKRQTLAKVRAGCELAYLNVKRILADFPALRALSRAQLEDWVLDQYCYMSVDQMKLNGIRQTPLDLDLRQTKESVRQRGWGRADTMPGYLNKEFVGWIDVKGSGLASNDSGITKQLSQYQKVLNLPGNEQAKGLDTLRTSAHSDGLLTLGEGIAETTRQTAAQMVFDLLNKANEESIKSGIQIPFETVETYFVIALPIDVLKNQGATVRAALYGRQAHFGRVDNGYPAPHTAYESYQSSNQHTHGYTAVDFGAVWITHPLLKDRFGPSIPGVRFDTQVNSLPWARGHETARRFSSGDRFAVYSHLAEMLGDEFVRLWQNVVNPTDEIVSTWIQLAQATRAALIASDKDTAMTKLNELLALYPAYFPYQLKTVLLETILKPYGREFAEGAMKQLDAQKQGHERCIALLSSVSL